MTPELQQLLGLELCWNLGDEADQAAWLADILMTSTPLWNLTPRTTFGNWFSPFMRRHVLAAASPVASAGRASGQSPPPRRCRGGAVPVGRTARRHPGEHC